jgi:hypothetical protein
MAQTAEVQKEINDQLIDWNHALIQALKKQREVLKSRLAAREICQVTFDEIDPEMETAILEAQDLNDQLQNPA